MSDRHIIHANFSQYNPDLRLAFSRKCAILSGQIKRLKFDLNGKLPKRIFQAAHGAIFIVLASLFILANFAVGFICRFHSGHDSVIFIALFIRVPGMPYFSDRYFRKVLYLADNLLEKGV
jgi:hypothetical protein